ncbi:MAG: hypothetical protein N2043_01980 [Ignavibacterium sp.]|nr:hypothetical protein [Ignavibacterium sp.]
MRTYTIEEIKDYLHCPVFYKWKWVNKKEGKRKEKAILEEIYLQALKEIAEYTFRLTEARQYPSWYLLKKKWEKIWIGHRDEKELLKQPMYNYVRRNHYRNLEKKGIKALLKFHDVFSKPGFPILINKVVRMKLKDKYIIEIPIDYIREKKEGEIELIQWVSSKPKNKFYLSHSVELIAQRYVLEKILNQSNYTCSIYSFDKGIFIESPKIFDLEFFERLVENIIQQIEQKIWYPRIGYWCDECPFKELCSSNGKEIFELEGR